MLSSHCRAICYEHIDWQIDRNESCKFSIILKSRLGKRWCQSISPCAICWAWIRYGHDRYISGNVICNDRIARLDTIKFVRIRLSRENSRYDLGLFRTSRNECPIRDACVCAKLIRSHTLRYVHHEPMFSVAMGYDNDGDCFYDQDWRWLRLDTIRPHNISI